MRFYQRDAQGTPQFIGESNIGHTPMGSALTLVTGDAFDVFVQAGQGLLAAHAAGLVHRDFKPENVMVGSDDRVRVLDFSVASAGEPSHSSIDIRASNPDLLSSQPRTITETEALVGTPAYMAPEQLRRLGADALSDQFSFCVALYEALHGARPYVGATIGELLVRMERGLRPAGGDGPRVPGRIARALARGLAHAPQQRHPSMRELLVQLRGGARKVPLWFIVPLAAAIVAAGAAVAWKLADEQGGACTRGQEQLVGVWDPEREQALRSAFLTSPIAYARDTLDRALPLLAAHADAWVVGYTQSCRAHQEGAISAELLDQRMSCLAARKGELRALVDVLTEGSASAIENASQAAGALVPIDRCSDDAAVGAHLRPPDPAIEADVRALGRDLARIKAEYDAGLYDSGLLLASAAVERAQALDFKPMLAEALGYHGMLLNQKGRFAEAETALLEAEVVADSHGDDRLRADYLAMLVAVVGERQSRPAEGLRIARRAWGALRRMGGDPAIEAWLLVVEGGLLRLQGENLDARARLERALELAEELPGDGAKVLALGELGNVAVALKEYPAAGRYLEQALALTRQELGPGHPKLVYFNNNLASLYMLDGRLDLAERALQEALQIAEVSLGVEHPMRATLLDSLGLVRLQRGDHRGAMLLFERARAILESSLGPMHASLMPIMLDLFEAQIAMKAVGEAIASADRAIAIREANGRDTVHDLYFVQLILRFTPQLSADHSERARNYLETALAMAQAKRSVTHVIGSLAALGQREHAAGRGVEARKRLTEAAAISASATADLDPAELGQARLALASAWWAVGEHDRALELAGSIALPDVGADELKTTLATWLAAARAGREPPLPPP